ncbi:type VII secretion-associated serine protease mycosin [Streptomyces sp. NPDC054940]
MADRMRIRTFLGVLALAAAAQLAVPPAGASTLPPTGQCRGKSVDTVPDMPWSQARLDAQRVWDLTQGAGQTVAVVDTGVDGSVPQLQGAVLRGSDVLGGTGRGDTDCVGHGTFVAGIIAARPAPGLKFTGLAPAAKILPIVQTSDGRDGTAAGMARAIRAAVDGGATVINVSANAPAPSDPLRSAVEYAAAKDVLIVASAGNADPGTPQQPGAGITYPAVYDEVLAVAATDREDQAATFSVAGDFVDLAAPGVDILSLGVKGPGYRLDAGTSFAAPYVAATAALVRARHPELTAAQVKHRLEATADRPASRVPDPKVGWGVVNPFNAVTVVVPGERGGDAADEKSGQEDSASAGERPTVPSASPGPDAAAAVPGVPAGVLPVVLGGCGIVVLAGAGVLAARLGRRRSV